MQKVQAHSVVFKTSSKSELKEHVASAWLNFLRMFLFLLAT